jgi:ABC-type sugar transport system ATPase subunit
MMQERSASAGNALLELKGISKAFPGVQALDNVSFSIERGEVHALLGANGAGKSTLIKILAGAVARDAGEVIFDGQRVALSNPHKVAEMGIACIFQEPALVPTLTVEQNIFLGKEKTNSAGWIAAGEQRAHALALLAETAPHISPLQKVRSLRTSERQLVALAKALLANAQLIIMDEPSASMTAQETETLFSAIYKLQKANNSVIYITHRLEEVFEVADRVTVLRDGRHIRTCGIGEITRPELVNLIAGHEVRAEERATSGNGKKGACLLEVNDLTRQPAFESISFKVHAGEIVALTGLVGAGHAEIVRAIFGADPIDSGAVRYPRKDAGKVNSPFDAVRMGVVMIPEDRKAHGIIPKMSVGKNMLLSSIQRYTYSLGGLIRGRVAEAAIERQVERLNIQPRGAENRAMETLSGGNQQKVIIARGIDSEAEVIIMDQPTAGVDVGAKSEIYEIIRELAHQGKGILLISLEVEEVLQLADRILVIREGKLVRELDGVKTSSHEVLQHALDDIIEEREANAD